MKRRILLKLSGETLAIPKKHKDEVVPPYNEDRINDAARTLAKLADTGVQLAVVFGGGNIWRGRFSTQMDPVMADQMGMLATIMNAIAVQEALTRMGRKVIVYTAQEMNRFAELYRADKAIASMNDGYIVLLAGGSGNPFFTTDTAVVLRGAELKADEVWKGTNVDGIFTKDPTEAGAEFLPDLTYEECLRRKFGIMDSTAFQLCQDQKIPCLRVFNMGKLENILAAARGEKMGTIVHP